MQEVKSCNTIAIYVIYIEKNIVILNIAILFFDANKTDFAKTILFEAIR